MFDYCFTEYPTSNSKAYTYLFFILDRQLQLGHA